MLFFNSKGYRTVAHDRRGNGYSDQPGSGNDVDTWADDLDAIMNGLDLRDAVLVGHSTGGGELARYISRHGFSRVSKMVLLDTIVPAVVPTNLLRRAEPPPHRFADFAPLLCSPRFVPGKQGSFEFYNLPAESGR
jgi:pimeloyl-ACP methyl ester carboxylesterase